MAVDVPHDDDVVQRGEGLHGEVVDPLVCCRRPDGRAVDVVDVEVVTMLVGLSLSWCAQDDADGAPLGSVVLWLERRLPDGPEVEAVLDEDGDVSSPNGPRASPAASPARDGSRLVPRYSQRAASQLRLLDRRHVHLLVRQPAAELPDLGEDSFRVPAG